MNPDITQVNYGLESLRERLQVSRPGTLHPSPETLPIHTDVSFRVLRRKPEWEGEEGRTSSSTDPYFVDRV